MRALQAELEEWGLAIPFVAIRDYRPELLRDDLASLETLFQNRRR